MRLLTIEVLEAVNVWFERTDKLRYERELQPGQRVALPQQHVSRLLKVLPEKIKVVAAEPPLQAGWFVAYIDRQGRYRGGCDEPNIGTVRECRWDECGWTITLANSNSIPLSRIVSVGKTDSKGNVIAAWTVKGCGYDGQWIGPELLPFCTTADDSTLFEDDL
jgi:hypothetical protein